MNLLALVTFLRTSILDDTGGTGVDWESISEGDDDEVLLRWTNEELVRFIAEAVRQVFRRILPIKDSSMSITLVVDQATYTLDSNIIQLLDTRLNSTGRSLCQTDIDTVWEIPNWDTQKGTPTHYIPNYDSGTVTFYPIPEAVDTVKLLVYRFPLVALSWTSNTASVELREEFLLPMLNYAAFMAYNKDEENTADVAQSNKFLGLFTQEFPFTSAYSDNRKRKTTNRGIAYGGLRNRSGLGRGNRYGGLPYDPYYN